MEHSKILAQASEHLLSLKGTTLDVIHISKPPTLEYAEHLAKTISKLSPLIGNMIEFKVCEALNNFDWNGRGTWKRQDPGFPDTIFDGDVVPAPGIEIKTWFPLATEMTARFKDSVNHFQDGNINVALVAWLPEYVIYGKPKIIDVWVGSAISLAQARDKHYHNPPDYLIFEPEDTSARTQNLQQTNTNGFKFQGSLDSLKEAKEIVSSWGENHAIYEATPEYQTKLKSLLKFPYRLDTNYAKIDRIKHVEMESFKSKVMAEQIHGHSLKQWTKLISDDTLSTVKLIKDLMTE